MPLYDYHCKTCDKTFELLVRSSTLPVCPSCGSGTIDKLVSAPIAPPRSPGIIASARKQAAREGHFSHYSRTERPR